MSRRQIQSTLRLLDGITPDLPIKSANGLLRTPTTATRLHILLPFEGGTIGYVDMMVCLAMELEMTDETREIHIQLHFNGFSPNEYSVSSVHCFSGLITYPVHGRVLTLEVYAGPTKPNDVDKFLSHTIDQIVGLQINSLEQLQLSHICAYRETIDAD